MGSVVLESSLIELQRSLYDYIVELEGSIIKIELWLFN